MGRVTFLELKVSGKERAVCDIIEKFYQQKVRTTVYFADKNKAVQLDNLLWTWKQDSFIPHCYAANGESNTDEPVVLTSSPLPDVKADVLILFDPLPPEQLAAFSTIIDFAEVYDPEKRSESRQRYKKLRDDKRFELDFYPLGAFLNS